MDLQAIFYFTLATVLETINPGPTLGLIIATVVAFQDRRVALYCVMGVALANAAWAAIVFFISSPALIANNQITMLVQFFSAGYLVFLASRRIISATVALILLPSKVTSVEGEAAAVSATATSAALSGFQVHFLNPLSPAYYFGPFYAATLGLLLATVVCATVAVLSDLLIYSAIVVGISAAKSKWNRDISLQSFKNIGPVVSLLAGLVFLFLVAHVFSDDRTSSTLSVSGSTAVSMLLGFTGAVFAEAHRLVTARKGLNNKILWRIVAMWGTWFSAAAILGGILALYQTLDPSLAGLHGAGQKIRICFIVAAFIATALAFAKAFGELQDEQFAMQEDAKAINSECWQASPTRAGFVVLGLLATVFAVLGIVNFIMR